jgi:cysteine synthase
MNTDVVAAVSDAASDALNLLFADDIGRKYLVERKKIDPEMVQMFDNVGLSGFANIVAAIKLARHFEYGANDVIMTVATDSAALYHSERQAYRARHYAQGFDEVDAGELFGSYLGSIADDHVLELTHVERKRIFNLGYYTWVEQQGVSIADFDRRKSQDFWHGLVDTIPAWDRLIEDFNDEVSGANA